MSYGYSARLIKFNKQADETRLGVTLGRVCIALDIPVSTIAQDIGISRQTIYNWFMGLHDPHPKCREQIVEIISRLDERK